MHRLHIFPEIIGNGSQNASDKDKWQILHS